MASKVVYKEVKYHEVTDKGYEVTVGFSGATYYTLDGEFHREDGPAVIWPDGNKMWCLNGKELPKEDFTLELILKMNASELFTVQELAKLRLENA